MQTFVSAQVVLNGSFLFGLAESQLEITTGLDSVSLVLNLFTFYYMRSSKHPQFTQFGHFQLHMSCSTLLHGSLPPPPIMSARGI